MKNDAIVTVDQLRGWFAHKGLINVVLRAEDVADLQPYMRAALAEVVKRLDIPGTVEGYTILPVGQLVDGRFNIIELGMLQEVVACYREARKNKAYPMVEKPCECGRQASCRICKGSGTVDVLVEMSPEEAELAYERKDGEAQAPQG